MIAAWKAGSKQDKQIYSNILDIIQKAEKRELRELADNEVEAVLQKYNKQCKETLDFAEKADNKFILSETKREMELLSEFLPKLMTEGEINLFLETVKRSIEPVKSSKGQFMKACSALKGKADMKLVSTLVDNILT